MWHHIRHTLILNTYTHLQSEWRCSWGPTQAGCFQILPPVSLVLLCSSSLSIWSPSTPIVLCLKHTWSWWLSMIPPSLIFTHLTSRAEAWAMAEWARNSLLCYSLELFTDTLRKIFDHTIPGRVAAKALMGLWQGKCWVSDYTIEFRTLAGDSGWNSPSLVSAFGSGLADPIMVSPQWGTLQCPQLLWRNQCSWEEPGSLLRSDSAVYGRADASIVPNWDTSGLLAP